MEQIFTVASLWLALAVLSTLIAFHLRMSVALVEICVGVIVAATFSVVGLQDILTPNADWVRFLAAFGAVVLTFLAGAELDPQVLRSKLREVSVVGLVGFTAPFFGCAALAHYALGWDSRASWLCGVALSTTSMAVVYAVMLETGFNKTEYGKGILGSCFINDLGTVIVLGLLFAPFTYKTIVFVVGNEDKVDMREILGTSWQGKQWIIEEGVHVGDRVIVDGLHKIAPGASVKPVPLPDPGTTTIPNAAQPKPEHAS